MIRITPLEQQSERLNLDEGVYQLAGSSITIVSDDSEDYDRIKVIEGTGFILIQGYWHNVDNIKGFFETCQAFMPSGEPIITLRVEMIHPTSSKQILQGRIECNHSIAQFATALRVAKGLI